jgi:membrane peptidoglycan carboxypeptidase
MPDHAIDLQKLRRQQRIYRAIALFATAVMLLGGVMVATVYFVDDVTIPESNLAKLDVSTSIYFDNGAGGKPVELARLGTVNRTVVSIKQIPIGMQEAIVAAEDKNFFTNPGIDIKGIIRAAWNNVTGGERQGASTITQQYARKIAELNDITYSRKAREAVLAVKLSRKYSKEKILENYLNTADFGRNAVGIEAASEAYFHKSIQDITPAEAMVLAALVKAPEGKDGFDPAQNLENSKARWRYIQASMRQLAGSHPGFLSVAEVDALQYPTIPPLDPSSLGTFGTEKGNPNGNIVNQVLMELRSKGITNVSTGGYRIYTTINQQAQAIAVKYAQRSKANDRKNPVSPLDGQPSNLVAALVAIDPATGGVLAYYGGDDPNGTDMAGLNVDERNGKYFGGHNPGSTFKVYTLATALSNGIAYDSLWNGRSPRKDFASAHGQTISNVGSTGNSAAMVTLKAATERSLNTVFYAVAEKLGDELDHNVDLGGRHIAAMAGAAGVQTMWNQADQPDNMSEPTSVNDFDNHVAFGQFKVTVQDNAAGYATFANGGVHMPTHFVRKVVDRNGDEVAAGTPKLNGNRAVSSEVAADVSYVLKGVRDHYNISLPGDRDAAVKTGTWQQGDTGAAEQQNAHAWMAGYTPNLAAAVWVGNSDGGNSKPLLYCATNQNTCNSQVYGATLPGAIWRAFMTETINTLKLAPKTFPPPANVGRADAGDVASPSPSPTVVSPSPDGSPSPVPSTEPSPTQSPSPSPSPTPGKSSSSEPATPPPTG